MSDETTPPTTDLQPPNGRSVTNNDLYEALYNSDLANAGRFNTLSISLNQLRGDFENHRQVGHASPYDAEITEAKGEGKAKVIQAVGLVIGTIGTAIAAILGVMFARPGNPIP